MHTAAHPASPVRARVVGRLVVAALGAALLLPGCGWFTKEKDPNPPAKLPKNPPTEVSIRTLWETRLGKGTDDKALALVPAVAGGRVYVADARGRVAALGAGDGRTVWERETKLPFSGGPDVAGDRLALGTSDGDVVLLSTRDGSQVWRAKVASEVLSVPRIVNDLVVVHTIDDSVYGLALADGSERWRFQVPAPVLTLRGSSTPVLTRDGVIIGVSGGRLVHLELTAGEPLWEVLVTPPTGRSELDRIADLDANPVVVGDIAYVGAYNGDLAAVDIALGTVMWRRFLSSHAGLAADEEAIYVTDSQDNVWAAEPADGAGRWQQEALVNRQLSGPALTGSALVVGDLEGYVHWLARRDGRLLGFTRVTKAPIRATPVVVNNIVYVYADNGTVAALTTGAAPAARASAPATADDEAPAPRRTRAAAKPAAAPAAADEAPQPLPLGE